ncbi:hypothetical protein LPW26_07470 [Rhodopseudomonas sp. HC1]|uniref:hypothetical protein n=1 Tax=Rhodopseudomonas infernalis TaxID=2897386 RepID=UPI001EE98220|nr:hypothetical protein [Rhodopseudomonas infernalis]MCG6204468.1 hypothetical protein [Rhodopseudomonas infernalis]
MLAEVPMVIKETRQKRTQSFGTLGMEFALGAFLVACFQHYIDPILSIDVGSPLIPLVGGMIAVTLGLIASRS